MGFYVRVTENNRYVFKKYDSIVDARARAIKEIERYFGPKAKHASLDIFYTKPREYHKAKAKCRVYRNWERFPEGVYLTKMFDSGNFYFKDDAPIYICQKNGKLRGRVLT